MRRSSRHEAGAESFEIPGRLELALPWPEQVVAGLVDAALSGQLAAPQHRLPHLVLRRVAPHILRLVVSIRRSTGSTPRT